MQTSTSVSHRSAFSRGKAFDVRVVIPNNHALDDTLEDVKSWLPSLHYDLIPIAVESLHRAPLVNTDLIVVPASMSKIEMANLGTRTGPPLLFLPKPICDFESMVPSEIDILLADDLTLHTNNAVHAAELFASLLRDPCELFHLHIASQSPQIKARYGERLVDDAHTLLMSRLQTRGARLRTLIEGKGGVYRFDAWRGHIPSEIHRAARGGVRHVNIFGRHAAFDWRRFKFGRLPYESMAAMTGALLLA